jgi:hypothetical protein
MEKNYFYYYFISCLLPNPRLSSGKIVWRTTCRLSFDAQATADYGFILAGSCLIKRETKRTTAMVILIIGSGNE